MAVAPPIIWREPEQFVAGDSLIFQRNLPNYLPSDGWAIKLTVSQPTANGAVETAQVNSAADPTNRYHQFNAPGFCAGVVEGVYILSEEVVNAAGNAPLGIAANTRHQIYYRDDFFIGPDLTDGLVTGEVLTEAQTNLQLLNSTYQELIKLKFATTEDLRSRFDIKKQKEILDDIKYWKEVRTNEIQMERVRNGRRPGNVSKPIFAIGE
jgi:hypothetical protein